MKKIISSDFRLGILGGGQLGKMLILAASNWDVNTYVLDPSSSCPSSQICTKLVLGDINCFETVYNFGKEVDVITIEIENVNLEALIKLKSEGKKVYPCPEKLAIIKDKGLQKEFYKTNGFPTSKFSLFDSENEIKQKIEKGELKLPFVQKLRKEGYDGRGVKILKEQADLNDLLIGKSLIEDKVDVAKELSVIVTRSVNGEIKCFPLVEMEFNPTANLVEYLICPANVSNRIEVEAEELAISLVKKLDYEGILAVEMFLDKENNLLINEVAPRAHNSGHHTIESIYTSQYEQQLRAILGFPLGSTEIKVPSIMINVLGEPNYEGEVMYSGMDKCMAVEGAKFHIYGKRITKPYRKMGHITILDKDINKAREKANYIKQNLKVIA